MRPYCHGTKMEPGYRTVDPDGKVYVTYKCVTCGRSERVKTSVGV